MGIRNGNPESLNEGGLAGLDGSDSRRLRDNEESAMPWAETDRVLYKACTATYSTSLTDAEFAHVEPLLPLPGKRGRLKHGFRTILDAILYLVRSGIPRRLLPMDF